MVITNQVKNQHLLWRAGFGPLVSDLQNLSGSAAEMHKHITQASLKKPAYIGVSDNAVDGLFKGLADLKRATEDEKASQTNRKEIAKQSRELIKNLNLAWFNEMVNSPAQLREKVSLFWHGHFACRNLNVFFQQILLDEIRQNALGKFGDLLAAVSKSAAMLAFLNNEQNRKSHPNENFAREVMELFTLGRGNYSESDVKEAARAFTGWGFNLRGEFVFRRFQHDNGSKTILGRTGNFDGDDVLNILLEQKPLAKFITRKAYRFFVNDTIDGHHVEWLAGRFYQSGYDISALMNDIFSSDWFYEQKNIGCIIKSPVALLAGMNRMLPADFENEAVLLQMQRALGQVLFYPPNVAGWPGGTSWIDSSALMLRLRLPQFIAGSEVFSIQNKSDDDQQMGRMETMVNNQFANMQKRFKSNVNWPKFIQQFDSVPRQHLYDVLEAVLLQTPPDSVNRASVDRVANASTRESYISSVAVALMSTPEYQLC